MPATARLFINGTDVGGVVLKSLSDPWGIGDFTPNDAFAAFAPLFGRWSLLMHADDDEQRMTPEASEALRRAEQALDSLHCKLRTDDDGEWIDVGQLNIDGGLIEWKVSHRNADPPEGLTTGEHG